ncbi:MAG: hypothetical protein ACE5EX_08620, partial [Phycisphaerae bacterium]
MPKFFNHDMEDLASQLIRSPHRLRVRQIHGIETLLGLIEADRAYPFDFVCYHITGYRKRGASTGSSIPGKALVSDLVTTAEVISRGANLPVARLEEPFKTQKAVADQLGVSTKTVRRWRNHGLMGLRVVYDDGVNRLAFLERTVTRFVRQNKKLVARGASFRQLTDAERRHVVQRARELVSREPLKLHAAARIIAEETGRAVETVRYTLRRHDAADTTAALFAHTAPGGACERDRAMHRCHESGEALGGIASAFDCTVAEVRQALRRVRAHRWVAARWDYVANELFDAPDADRLILDAPEPLAPDAPPPKPRRELTLADLP